MAKMFKEKLEEYLLELEREFNAPERYRIYVMGILDRTEQSGKRNLSDDEFERIKGIARNAYKNAVETSEHLSRIKDSLDTTDLKTITSRIKASASKLEDELRVLDALKSYKGPKSIN